MTILDPSKEKLANSREHHKTSAFFDSMLIVLA